MKPHWACSLAAVQAPLGHRMRFKRAFSQLRQSNYAYGGAY